MLFALVPPYFGEQRSNALTAQLLQQLLTAPSTPSVKQLVLMRTRMVVRTYFAVVESLARVVPAITAHDGHQRYMHLGDTPILGYSMATATVTHMLGYCLYVVLIC